MATKGYMEHMKKVNQGLEYMYPNRGKGIRKNESVKTLKGKVKK